MQGKTFKENLREGEKRVLGGGIGSTSMKGKCFSRPDVENRSQTVSFSKLGTLCHPSKVLRGECSRIGKSLHEQTMSTLIGLTFKGDGTRRKAIHEWLQMIERK